MGTSVIERRLAGLKVEFENLQTSGKCSDEAVLLFRSLPALFETVLMLVVEKRTLKSSANSGLRDFRADHAQRWTRDGQETGPGRGVQIDHMTVSRDGRTLKQCQTTCPSGRFMVTQEFSRDTAGNAKRFLAAVIEDLPCPLQPIQVDGGSEFRIQDAGELSVREAGHALAGCRHFCN